MDRIVCHKHRTLFTRGRFEKRVLRLELAKEKLLDKRPENVRGWHMFWIDFLEQALHLVAEGDRSFARTQQLAKDAGDAWQRVPFREKAAWHSKARAHAARAAQGILRMVAQLEEAISEEHAKRQTLLEDEGFLNHLSTFRLADSELDEVVELLDNASFRPTPPPLR